MKKSLKNLTVLASMVLWITACEPEPTIIDLDMDSNRSNLIQMTQTTHQAYVVGSNTTKLKLDVGSSPIEIQKTKGSRILVEMTIKVPVPSKNTLAYLVESGRYDLSSETRAADSTLVISTKKNNNKIIIKGVHCPEDISFVVSIPNNIQLVDDSPGISNSLSSSK